MSELRFKIGTPFFEKIIHQVSTIQEVFSPLGGLPSRVPGPLYNFAYNWGNSQALLVNPILYALGQPQILPQGSGRNITIAEKYKLWTAFDGCVTGISEVLPGRHGLYSMRTDTAKTVFEDLVDRDLTLGVQRNTRDEYCYDFVNLHKDTYV